MKRNRLPRGVTLTQHGVRINGVEFLHPDAVDRIVVDARKGEPATKWLSLGTLAPGQSFVIGAALSVPSAVPLEEASDE